MPRGGPRPGAGRPKGSRDKRPRATAEDPLAYMLRVMRDPNAEDDRRDRMAIAAAPYLHQPEKPKEGQDG